MENIVIDTEKEARKIAHYAAIKALRAITKAKRKTQFCRVYEVKVDSSHLNNETQEHLNRLFIEAKWFYNNLLKDVYGIKSSIKEVPVKVQCAWNIRTFECLSAQMKQGLIDRTKDNIVGLAARKKKGHKVGALKYISEVESIPLPQFGITHRISGKYIAIQGLKQPLKVIGLNQIPEGVDFANATLIHRSGNYYVSITTFQDKDKQLKVIHPIKSVGIDFNIAKQMVLSNGIAIQYKIEVTPKLKRIARKLSKQKRFSKNWKKTRIKLNKEYDYLTNIKEDIKNKVVSHLKDNVEIICFQDESIKAWQRIWGKRILSTSIGGIIDALKQKAHTPVEINKFFPSTKTCSKCGNKQPVALSERVYVCNKCNNTLDRDYNSALNIKSEGLKNVGMVHTELTPVEILTYTSMVEYFKTIPHIKASLVYESGSLSPFRAR